MRYTDMSIQVTQYCMALAVVLLSAAPAPPPADPQASVPGTYLLTVCKGPCSVSSNIVVKGVLVLTAKPFSRKAVEESSPEPFELANSLAADLNGCFVLDTVKQGQTYAGL